MVKFEKNRTILDRPWDQMVEAVVQKYPNPHNKSARVNDILNRWVDEENRIHSGRYSGSKFPVPSIISSTFYQFTGIRFPELAFSYEYSVLDKSTKSLKQYARNITMGSFLNFVEIIEYTATEDGKCLMKQDWSCKTHIGRYIDGWFESQFLGICRKNAQDGIKGLNWVADRIHGEAADLIDLEEFRTKLKIFYQDVVHEVEEQLEEVKGQIEEAKLKSAETLENVSDEVKQLELGITKKVEELYTDTKETLGNNDLEYPFVTSNNPEMTSIILKSLTHIIYLLSRYNLHVVLHVIRMMYKYEA